jgi:hypothetical protein
MVFQRLAAHGLARLKLRASPLFLPWFVSDLFEMLTEEAGVPPLNLASNDCRIIAG